MKYIELSRGKRAIVDDEDYEWLNQWKWYCKQDNYAARVSTTDNWKTQTFISMHRLIMNTPTGMTTDHKNGNSLDNRRCNLRIATHSENQFNRGKQKNCSSKYKGIHWDSTYGKWKAKIHKDDTTLHIGYFASETDAAMAYDYKATQLFGQFARLNFPPS